MDTKQHWEQVYRQQRSVDASWYQAHPALSLDLITRCGLPADAPVIDVGGGASTLTDHLLAQGYLNLTVLDIAGEALQMAQRRLGPRAETVRWREHDILGFRPPHRYALWHDRAVFHFLTDAADRERYRETLERSLLPGGHLIIATFARQGPTRCSGLDIVQYDSDDLRRELGAGFELLRADREVHHTPGGSEQAFQYGLFRRMRTLSE